MKEQIRQTLLDLISEGAIHIDLPPSAIEDGLRSRRELLADMIADRLENGSFPHERVHNMMEERAGEWRAAFNAAIEVAVARLEGYVNGQRIIPMGVKLPDGKVVETGLQHKSFAILLKSLMLKQNTYLVGPAGSGKTTAAEQAAKALGVEFAFTGAITSEYKLTGFIDAQGRCICPAFRKTYENGGLFLFDEIDASMPQAVLAFNAAIANGYMDFPDGMIKKHKDFYCIAAANTFGVGADRIYVGRNQMDGATIDRFSFIEWGYDQDLELAITLAEVGDSKQVRDWVTYVQKVREACAALSIKHVVSPRASKAGAIFLKSGMDKTEVRKMTLWKGMDSTAVGRVQKNLKETAALE